MKKYTVALTGYGPRGKTHAMAFQANAGRFDIVAACDLVPERRKEAHRELGEGVSLYESTADMLEKERPDVFCFCTMPSVRLEMFELAAQGIATTFCQRYAWHVDAITHAG